MSFYDNNNLTINNHQYDDYCTFTPSQNDIICRNCVYKNKGQYDLIESFDNSNEEFKDFNQGLTESNEGFDDLNEGFGDLNEGFVDLNEGCTTTPLTKLDKIFSENKQKIKKEKGLEVTTDKKGIVEKKTEENCFSSDGLEAIKKLEPIFNKKEDVPVENIITKTSDSIEQLFNPRSTAPLKNIVTEEKKSVKPVKSVSFEKPENLKEEIFNLNVSSKDIMEASQNISNTIKNTITPDNINLVKGAVDDVSKDLINNLSEKLSSDISKNLSKNLNLSTSMKVKDLYVNVAGVMERLEPLKDDVVMDMGLFLNIVKGNTYIKKDALLNKGIDSVEKSKMITNRVLGENLMIERFQNNIKEGFQNNIKEGFEILNNDLFSDILAIIIIVVILVILIFRK